MRAALVAATRRLKRTEILTFLAPKPIHTEERSRIKLLDALTGSEVGNLPLVSGGFVKALGSVEMAQIEANQVEAHRGKRLADLGRRKPVFLYMEQQITAVAETVELPS